MKPWWGRVRKARTRNPCPSEQAPRSPASLIVALIEVELGSTVNEIAD